MLDNPHPAGALVTEALDEAGLVAQIKWSQATNDSLALINAARRAVDRLWQSGFRYSKAGIITQDLEPPPIPQRALFDNLDHEKAAKVMAAMDEEPALGAGHGGAGGHAGRAGETTDLHDEVRDAEPAIHDALG
jgi:hypothetical protein